MVDKNKWFLQLPGKLPPRMRLFCFPFAGGGASFYRPWRDKLPEDVEIVLVCLPGREQRFGEQVIDTIDVMVEHIFEAISPLTDLPYAFFGYSMGAIISHHLACEIVVNGGVGPSLLFLSARRSPDLELTRAPLNGLPSDSFWKEVVKYGGTPKEIYENQEYRQLFEAPLRADFKLSETAVSKDLPRLSCPITVFGGDTDTSPVPKDLDGWANATSGAFAKHVYHGGHFFITDHLDAVTAIVSDRLESVA
ncbi:thioesterase [Thalassospira sp. HF15]|uniref:thioesterase II family protein n=1 Tax=Thalassospira sp. HF15 TaxID=2722755 RepID=UPI001431DCD0|nr:alpha/beta fold hydrolase [Thalassospira sp. HF15]NIY74359.1 thioesterase [Thalassospira sp. HF15]